MSRWFYVELHRRGDLTEDDLDDQLDSLMAALTAEPGDADADMGAIGTRSAARPRVD